MSDAFIGWVLERGSFDADNRYTARHHRALRVSGPAQGPGRVLLLWACQTHNVVPKAPQHRSFPLTG